MQSAFGLRGGLRVVFQTGFPTGVLVGDRRRRVRFLRRSGRPIAPRQLADRQGARFAGRYGQFRTRSGIGRLYVAVADAICVGRDAVVALHRVPDCGVLGIAAGQVQYRRTAARRVSGLADTGVRTLFRFALHDGGTGVVGGSSGDAHRIDRDFFGFAGVRYTDVFVEIQNVGMAWE